MSLSFIEILFERHTWSSHLWFTPQVTTTTRNSTQIFQLGDSSQVLDLPPLPASRSLYQQEAGIRNLSQGLNSDTLLRTQAAQLWPNANGYLLIYELLRILLLNFQTQG